MKKLAGLCILLFVIAALIAPGMAAAQNTPSVRLIPVTGEQVIARLSPDGHTLAAIDNVNLHAGYEVVPLHLPIQLVDLDTGKVLWLTGFTDHAWDIAYAPDGTRLISLHGSGEIIVWDVASRTALAHYHGMPGMRGIAVLPDGNSAVIRLPTQYALLSHWNLSDGTIDGLWTMPYQTYAELQAQMANGSIPDGVAALAAAPDGTWVAESSYFGRIWRWDVATGQPTLLADTENTVPQFNIRNLTFTADGSKLIYWDNQADMINVMDTASGDIAETIPANTRFEPAISADGSRMIWVDQDLKTLMQWDNGTVTDLGVDLSSITLPDGVSLAPSSPTPALFLTPDGTRVIFSGFFAPDLGANVIAVIDLAS